MKIMPQLSALFGLFLIFIPIFFFGSKITMNMIGEISNSYFVLIPAIASVLIFYLFDILNKFKLSIYRSMHVDVYMHRKLIALPVLTNLKGFVPFVLAWLFLSIQTMILPVLVLPTIFSFLNPDFIYLPAILFLSVLIKLIYDFVKNRPKFTQKKILFTFVYLFTGYLSLNVIISHILNQDVAVVMVPWALWIYYQLGIFAFLMMFYPIFRSFTEKE